MIQRMRARPINRLRSRIEADMTTEATAPTDEELLLDYARSGSEEALAVLVARRWRHAYRLSFRLLGDGARAEDAAQDAFVALVRNAARFEEGKEFLPWFRTLVLNAARMSKRSSRTRQRHEARWADARPAARDASIDARLAAEEVSEQLSKLAERERSPIVLHFYEGCSYEEIATVLGCPKPTVQSRIRKGLEQLEGALAGAKLVLVGPALEDALRGLGDGDARLTVPSSPRVATLVAAARKATLAALVAKLAVATVALAVVGGAAVAVLPALGRGGPAVALVPTPPAPLAPPAPPGAPGDETRKPVEGAPAPTGDATDPKSRASGASGAEGRKDLGRGFLVTLRSPTGDPVRGAWLRVTRQPEREDSSETYPGYLGERIVAHTDERGVAFVKAEPGSERFVLHAARGPLWARSGPVELAGEATVPITIDMKPLDAFEAGHGSALVTASGPAGPIANATFEGLFMQSLGRGSHGRTVTVETDEQGRLALPDLAPSTWELRIRHEDFLASKVPVKTTAGTVAKVAVMLEAGAALAGRVVGARGSEARVHLVRDGAAEESIDTKADGAYRFRGVPKGSYRIEARAAGMGAVGAAVEVDATGEVRGPDLVLGAGTAVTGVVVSERGAAVPGVSVALGVREGRTYRLVGAAALESSGAFRLEGVAGGTYDLIAIRHDPDHPASLRLSALLERACRADPKTTIAKGVTIASTGISDLGRVVLAGAQRVRVVGQLRDGEGRAVTDAKLERETEITLRAPDGKREVGFYNGTTGEFECTLDSTTYVVVARQGDLVCREAKTIDTSAAALGPVELVLVPGGAITGRIAAPRERLADLEVIAEPLPTSAPEALAFGRRTGRVDAKTGGYRIPGLVAARYRVFVPAIHRGDEVQVAAGADSKLDFSLASGSASLRVRVTGVPEDTRGAKVLALRASGPAVWLPDPEQIVAAANLADGEALLTKLPEGTMGVALAVEDRVVLKQGVTVSAGEPATVELAWPDASEAAAIDGSVELGGAKPAGVVVVAASATLLVGARVEADGTFHMKDVPPGTYRIVCGRLGLKPVLGEAKEVTVLAKKGVSGVALTVPAE